MKDKLARLNEWQRKYNKSRQLNESSLAKMADRDALYKGTREVRGNPNKPNQETLKSAYVRNIVFENVESQIDSSIPVPRVDPYCSENEWRSKAIEDMLRGEILRLPLKELNDLQERVCKVQGGSFFHLEWNSGKRTHTTVGELSIHAIHPRDFVPQGGVYELDDMDYMFVNVSMSKQTIKRRFGVDVKNETRDDPRKDEDILNVHIAYYYNSTGGVGVFAWVNNTVLMDMEDFQARRIYRCARCGLSKAHDEKVCSCGSKDWQQLPPEFEIILHDMSRSDGTVIASMSPKRDEAGQIVTTKIKKPVYEQGQYLTDVEEEEVVLEATKIPYYTPNLIPILMRRNVSVDGQLLGGSDADAMADPQDMITKLGHRIAEKVLMGGTILCKPDSAEWTPTDEVYQVLTGNTPADYDGIKGINLQADIEQDTYFYENCYESARKLIGNNDSWQGRPDSSADSGRAKEIQIQRTAGRLQSKGEMKNSFYARLYEVMFKFMLAYADEPRTYISQDAEGKRTYSTFNRYDYLKQDDAGVWYWDDLYLFSTDVSGSLAQDRFSMWREATEKFLAGTYGSLQDPYDRSAFILYWREMDALHYPLASTKVEYWQRKQQQIDQMLQQQQQAMMQQQPSPRDQLESQITELEQMIPEV